MNEKQRKEAQASYMKRWREKNPHASRNNNDKINKAKSIQCGCGGSYKDISHLRTRHTRTAKHRCWEVKKDVMSLFIEAGKHLDMEESSTRIDAKCEKMGAYTNNDKMELYTKMREQLLKKQKVSEESVEESEEEEAPLRETHYQKVIRMSQEQEYQEPKNTIIKVKDTTPSTPCPSSSESEDERLIYRSKEELERDRQNAINRFKRFKATEFAEEPPSPPPRVNMGGYLDDASIPPDDDPYGDKALEQIKQRLYKFV